MNSLPSAKRLSLAGLALLLAACQTFTPAPKDKPLEAQRIAWEHQRDACQATDCALVNVDTLRFIEEPALSELIERRLLAMTGDSPGRTPAATLADYEREFLQRADARWATYLQAKILDQHGQLTVVELSSYLATGADHGMPGRGFINYDRRQDRALGLQDVLLPGQEDAFWRLAAQAHKRWLVRNGFDQDAGFVADWPFQRTENVALKKDEVLLKYPVDRIAPYSAGHPELHLPYALLHGILKPEYFPSRG
jgi:hypothetical protein